MLSLDSAVIPDIHPEAELLLRKAKLSDIEGISNLISYWAVRGQMLVRSKQLLSETIRDFFVLEALPHEGKEGGIAGVGGLHILAPNLAEVRGLAIHPHVQGKGLGRKLVHACEAEARAIDMPQLFAWTYQQKFFESCGFTRIDKSNLHPKVWSECQRCAFFENCNEIAMLKVLS